MAVLEFVDCFDDFRQGHFVDFEALAKIVEQGDGEFAAEVLAVIRGGPATRDLPVVLAPDRPLTDDERGRAERASCVIIDASEPVDMLVVHATIALSSRGEDEEKP